MTIFAKLPLLRPFSYLKLIARNMPHFVVEDYDVDRFKCVHLNARHLKAQDPGLVVPTEFDLRLQESLVKWREEGLRGVWCRVPIELSELVPVLVKNEFAYHHAKPAYVAMVKWICESESNNIPSYPYTNIGVGGLVIDDENRVLVVQEKYHIVKKMWKFPGGHASKGENFGETAVREVFEETGIKAKFQSIVVLRHMHQFQFGGSDIYIVCHLKPESSDLTKCPNEIEQVAWMPMDELLPQLTEFNRFVIEKYLLAKEKGLAIEAEEVPFFLGGTQCVYSLNKSHL